MDGGTTLPELRRAIGPDGRSLLRKYNLLKPLVEQMITSEAIAGVPVPADALEKAKLELLDQRGFETMEQWSEMLADLDRSDDEVIDRLERVIRRQIEQGLEGLDANRLVVAYEPIWAIGTGKTCEASEANRICGLIRSWVGAMDLVIQYGGSVKPANIDELMAMSDIDGVLVGGASLKPDGFARIANYQTP